MRRAAYETARLKLAHVRLESGQAVVAGLGSLTQTAADALEVDRVGLWFLEDGGREIVCKEQFVRATRSHTSGTVLRARQFPTYMRALQERRAIVADVAREHPATRELTQDYLEPNGIASLLDAPIFRRGEVVGVVCHERVGQARPWSDREVDFAGSVADLAALILEQGDRVELEAALKVQAEEQLMRQKLEALALLARSVGHDLNNVLAVFAATATEVEDHGLQETAESMLEAVEAGKRLSKQLFEVGERRAEHTDTNVGKAVKRMLGPLRALAGARVHVELDVEGSDLCAQISEGNLERVLFNLVANARDAIAQGGSASGQVHIAVRRATDADEVAPDFVIIELADDGCGMDARARAHLFEPYFTTKSEGHGLGLATVYGIIKRAGGSIDVASSPGQGASFRIALPAAG